MTSVAELDLDLDVFQGPFDLLLAVLLREEISIAEVSLGEIVIAYVEHLEDVGELDLESVLLAGANRRLNRIEVALIGATVAALVPGSFDLVVANLLLTEIAPEIAAIVACLRPRGELIYSGALVTDRDQVMVLGRTVGLHVAGEKVDGEWASWRLQHEGRT